MSSGTAWIFLYCFLAILLMMVLAWPVSLARKNVTMVDSLWGLGFILIAWLAFSLSNGLLLRKILTVSAVTIWGMRLSIYLTRRNWGKGEDPRYGAWRETHGERFWIVSLFKVFVLQAIILWIIALPVISAQTFGADKAISMVEMMGVLIWVSGFLFESIGDWQLARFKANPDNKGKVMDQGLWRYTRHPNYFGECLMWWGIFLLSAPVSKGLFTIISPLLLTFLLLRVSGVAMTEKSILDRKPHYADYIRKTSSFIPWFPKK